MKGFKKANCANAVEPNQYDLVDDDAKACRVIEDDELYASYVDRNIAAYRLDGSESWAQVPNPDEHNVILTYTNGSQTSVLIGSISLDNGARPDQHFKSGGRIYPIDKSGVALFDAANTPNLAFIRNQYWDMAKKQVATNLLFAEIVASFASDIAGLGHTGEASN